MPEYEYRVVAAPTRGVKAKGIRSAEARFAHALEEMMNAMATEGWEYQRAETLPSVERSGLTSTTTNWRNLLVFRRMKSPTVEESATPRLLLEDALPEEDTEREEASEIVNPQTPEDDASKSEGASRMLRDNGVEELSEVSGLTSSLKQLAKNRKTDKPDD